MLVSASRVPTLEPSVRASEELAPPEEPWACAIPAAVQGLFFRTGTTSDYNAAKGFRGCADDNDFSSVVAQSVT